MSQEQNYLNRFHLDDHPLTGVRSSGGIAPENRNRIQSRDALSLTSVYGKICEQAAVSIWQNGNPPRNPVLTEAARDIRERLTPATRKVTSTNTELEPYYQALTLPPEIPFLGNERLHPSLDVLDTLFKEVHRTFGLNLPEQFSELSETHQGSGVVVAKLRYLVETGLILTRLVEDQNLFANSKVIGNYWLSNVAQFDAVASINNSDPDWRSQSKWPSELIPIEIKVDYRARHTTGHNRLDNLSKGALPRHKREMQLKFARIIEYLNSPIELPAIFYVVYLRGLLPSVTHGVSINQEFLSDWRIGLNLAIEHKKVPPDKTVLIQNINSSIEDRMKLLDDKRNHEPINQDLKQLILI